MTNHFPHTNAVFIDVDNSRQSMGEGIKVLCATIIAKNIRLILRDNLITTEQN